MDEQETRQMLADAILRGEAVCYGWRIQVTPEGTYMDPMDGQGPGKMMLNTFTGFTAPIYVCTRTESDGSQDGAP